MGCELAEEPRLVPGLLVLRAAARGLYSFRRFQAWNSASLLVRLEVLLAPCSLREEEEAVWTSFLRGAGAVLWGQRVTVVPLLRGLPNVLGN